MAEIFESLKLRELTIPNRVWMSPMCTYAADPTPSLAGQPTDFHLAHYASQWKFYN